MERLGAWGVGRYMKLFGVEDRRVGCLMGTGGTWRHRDFLIQEKEAGNEGSGVSSK